MRRHVWPEQSGPGGEREEERAGRGQGGQFREGLVAAGRTWDLHVLIDPCGGGGGAGLGLAKGPRAGVPEKEVLGLGWRRWLGLAWEGGRGRRGGGTKARVACAARPSRTGKAEPRLANV